MLSQIDSIVMLMLENRSFDTMLGWLHSDRRSPINLIPSDSLPAHFDGIDRDRDVNWDGGRDGQWPYRPMYGSASLGLQRWRVPRQDPHEGMSDVQKQMYGDAFGIIADHNWGHPPMTGFARDYASMLPPAIGEVMGAYTPDELPVLSGLAKNFAVSDRWFCSVPTETDPNRAFSLCGTSQGKTTDLSRPFEYTAPTMFNGLNTGTKDWGIYYQTAVAGLPINSPRLTYTEVLFAEARAALAERPSRGRIDTYETFLQGLETGDLPSFCYLEPTWGWGVHDPGSGRDFVGWQGNDYHPPTWVGPAEADLAALYTAILSSRLWTNMLFIITFDEHGGTWDHVPPPEAANPDGLAGDTLAFAFTRLGPRVPTILVSPFVKPNTVFRAPTESRTQFDHTSIIKTVLQWAGADPSFMASMGHRVNAAPTFDHVLTTDAVQPHPTMPTVPAHFDTQPKKGPHGFDFDASMLTIFDHRAALAASSDLEGYIALLRDRALGASPSSGR